MNDKVRFFKALGDDTRLNIVRCLMHDECEASDLMTDDEGNDGSVFHGLNLLTDAGIIESHVHNSKRKYRLADGVHEILSFLGIEPLVVLPEENGIDHIDVKTVVRDKYSRIASEGGDCRCNNSCCGKGDFDPVIISSALGYSEGDLHTVSDANLGLGCGNPTALGSISPGETVLDMGSGAGLDSFLAAMKVGDNGKVIGIDMTEDMIVKARDNAIKYGFENVEFRWGDIENMPVESSSIDLVLSNCVINLVPDKEVAFQEAYRVLKPEGRMYISDMVLTGELTDEQRMDAELISGCVAGAISRYDYLDKMESAGFSIEDVKENRAIADDQYDGLPVASLHVKAVKRTA